VQKEEEDEVFTKLQRGQLMARITGQPLNYLNTNIHTLSHTYTHNYILHLHTYVLHIDINIWLNMNLAIDYTTLYLLIITYTYDKRIKRSKF